MKPVLILMGVYDGAEYLPDQLESLKQQSHENWRLTCSDDNSKDGSRALIAQCFKDEPDRVELLNGPGLGFSENFLSMIRSLPDDTGPVMFADQDDVWNSDKIARALEAVGNVPADTPALYGSASWIWDAASNSRKKSQTQRRRPGFLNALVENFATGNTMMFNPTAARLLRDASQRIGPVFAHDWWAYALISGTGGTVIYDDTPTLLYRQHGQNEIGAAETFLKRQMRNLSVADGRYRRKVGQQVAALNTVRDMLTADNRSQLDAFATMRDTGNAAQRLMRLVRMGVFRQSRRDMIGLFGATLLGKV